MKTLNYPSETPSGLVPPSGQNRFYLIDQYTFDLIISPKNAKPVAEIYTDIPVSVGKVLLDVFGSGYLPEGHNFHIIRASKWDALARRA